MSLVKKIARRSFLIGSTAVAGGVVFGVNWYHSPGPNPLLNDAKEGEAIFNPYVKIDASGVTLITPRADMGQGAYHAQTLLICEELDIDPSQVAFEPGQPSPAYWNTAFAPEAAAGMPGGEEGAVADLALPFLQATFKLMGMQMTGGSTTVRDGFIKLRQAGASARETLKAAAAKKTGNRASDLNTEMGAVILPDGSQIPYTELAADAAQIKVIQDVPLRPNSEWKYLGKKTKRVDILPKCTGIAEYGIDTQIEGMVHAAVKTNPAQLGAIKSFDGEAAKAMRGVQDVVAVTNGYAVIADNSWRAFQALDAVTAEWEASTLPPSMDDHWRILGESFTDERFEAEPVNKGDVDAALASGSVISAEMRAPYLAHVALEPLNAIVLITDDGAEVWTGTQAPRFVQANVARIAGLTQDQVRVNVPYLGGGFGLRAEDDVVQRCAEIAVQMKGVPVKLTLTREEDFARDYPRQISLARYQGTVKDGGVESLLLEVAMPSVTESQFGRQGLSVPGADPIITAGAGDQPFAIPNLKVRGYRAPALAPLSSWRSVGASSNGFMFNTALDELIEAAGADPMDERIRLCHDERARNVLETLKEISEWQGSKLSETQGRGVAFSRAFGVNCGEVVDVTMTENGIRIDRVFCVADVGTVIDPDHFENQAQGGVIWGLGHAINCETTYTNGIADQTNYHQFEAMRLYQCPEVIIHALETDPQIRGIGEPPVPPAAPALASAIYAVTGTRLREMPFNKFVDFV